MRLSIITPTHNIEWLQDTYKSLLFQQYADWEWIVLCNGPKAGYLQQAVKKFANDKRVRVEAVNIAGESIGAIKGHAFRLGTGEALIELDHDDLLVPDALFVIAKALWNHPECGFFYSDWADFSDGKERPTYLRPGARKAWLQSGWKFTKTRVASGVRPGIYPHPIAFSPSAAALSSILWAPNHVRVWRTDLYHKIGGHNPRYQLSDDHELLIRTYLATQMHHINQLLYLYRVSGKNTWAPRANEIGALSRQLGRENLEALILREAQLRKLPVFDLGAGDNPRAGWSPVDVRFGTKPHVLADLRKEWPWPDDSVFAFRAQDLLEHLPDKQHTMNEIWRCLAPGGWLLSSTPSTDGRGAFMDPTHVSYWNQNSFWYWTRPEFAKYIGNHYKLFSEAEITTYFPTQWHTDQNVPYVRAHLQVRKDGWHGPRG